jgi:hypothetical protein
MSQNACQDQGGTSLLFFGKLCRIVLGNLAFAVIVGEDDAWTSKLKDPMDKTLADRTSAWASAKPKQAVCSLK